MSARDLELARQFMESLQAAAQTGDKEPVYPYLASDVEWVTPMRTLDGIDSVREQHTWGLPPDNLDIEFEEPVATELGEGAIAFEVVELYRMKGTGELAYTRKRRVTVTIQDGKVARYEMRVEQ
jgi:hypothetical protein